jgi:hypothetical protein
MELNIDLRLSENDAKIEQMIYLAFRDELNMKIPALIPQMQKTIKEKTRPLFYKSPAYHAILNGPLNADFGIPKGEEKARLDVIFDTIVNNLEVTFNKITYAGKTFRGGIEVGVILADYRDILNLSQSVVITEKGVTLPWVEWLTLRGSEVIITNHLIKFGEFSDPKYHSRSEKAVMIKGQGAFWIVPTEYAGTARDNWLTRSITELGDTWIDMIGETIKYYLES